MTGAFTEESADKFIRTASGTWKSYKSLTKAAKPLKFIDKGLTQVDNGLSGHLAYSSMIDRLGTFISAQKQELAELARGDENYWIAKSGIDAFNLASVPKVRDYIDRSGASI